MAGKAGRAGTGVPADTAAGTEVRGDDAYDDAKAGTTRSAADNNLLPC